MHDLRWAVRSLRKQPGFTALALLTLALGVGATTTAFTVLDTVLLRPLPYEASDRLVLMRERTVEGRVMATEVDTGRFTVGVFQDVEWAARGVDALKKQGLAVESLSILGKASPALTAFIERQLGTPQSMEIADLGPAVARGPLVAALQGSDQGLLKLGISGTMRRVGFQAHDGRIFDTLTARGGVLVAIHSEPRAADALAVLHSYGGGNAAIGAWTGRV